jgi:phage baseplate assembly protein gpV
MTIPGDLAGQITYLFERIGEIERRDRNRKRTGRIADLDLAKGLARVEFQEADGKPYKGPWMPWKEVAAGGIKSHIPPTVGEQVDVTSENGDMTDGIIDMSTPSNENPRPHDGPEAVITHGGSRLVIGDGVVTITADVEINGALRISGDEVTHNGTNIGDTHVHGGVMAGGSDTETPH